MNRSAVSGHYEHAYKDHKLLQTYCSSTGPFGVGKRLNVGYVGLGSYVREVLQERRTS